MAKLKATEQRPIYSVYIVSHSLKINVTPILTGIERTEADGQIAQRVTLTLTNTQIEGVHISSFVDACDRVYVYADDGEQKKEVFRGFLWERSYKSSISEHKLRLTAYDNLIYLQQSEATFYFPTKMSTKDIVSTICRKWGIKLSYEYNEVTHPKLPVKGKLYDILTADILDAAAWQTGSKYVVYSDQDVMHVKLYGTNTTIYKFLSGENVSHTTTGWSMEKVITQVAITGEKNDNDYEPVVKVVTGNTAKYGTLQKLMTCDDVTHELWRVSVVAESYLNNYGKPVWEYEITGPDIPWIRKGDKVYVDAGDIDKKYIYAKEIRRTSDGKSSEMTITLDDGRVWRDGDNSYKTPLAERNLNG